MKITFLGTGGGIPRKGKKMTCMMLEVNNAIYFIDAGAPVIEELAEKDVDINKVRAVFTTHCHGDHTSGLFNMTSIIDEYYKNATVEYYLTDERLKSMLEEYMVLVTYNRPTFERTKLLIAKEGQVYRDENISVHYIPTKHEISRGSISPSYAILVEAEGKKVLFSGDLSGHLKEKDFPQIALTECLDAMILEFAHFTYDDVKPYLEKCMTKQLWINHYSYSKISNIYESRALHKYPICFAEDGDILEV